MAEEQGSLGVYNRIIAKAWSDPAFKERLVREPKIVAQEFGFTIPPGVDFKVVENTPNVVYMVLPAKPAENQVSEELSERELETVAGGIEIASLAGKYSITNIGLSMPNLAKFGKGAYLG